MFLIYRRYKDAVFVKWVSTDLCPGCLFLARSGTQRHAAAPDDWQITRSRRCWLSNFANDCLQERRSDPQLFLDRGLLQSLAMYTAQCSGVSWLNKEGREPRSVSWLRDANKLTLTHLMVRRVSVGSVRVSSIRPGAHLTLQSVSNTEDQIQSLPGLMQPYQRDTFSCHCIAIHQDTGVCVSPFQRKCKLCLEETIVSTSVN